MTEFFKWSIVHQWMGTNGLSKRLSPYCLDGLISLEIPKQPSLSFNPGLNTTTTPAQAPIHYHLTEEELIELIGTVQQWHMFIFFFVMIMFAFVVARLSKWVVIGAQKDQVRLYH